jgi:3-oxoacyl-[acyl-carrier-protein] synthase-1
MLAVTGLGMMTAVGYGAVGTVAALRADMSRPRPHPTFRVVDGEGGETAVVGHPVTSFAEGFTGPGAWVRLALGAFTDLVHGAELPTTTDEAFWSRTGLALLGPAADAERFPELLDEAPDAWERLYARPVVDALRIPWAEGHVRVLGLGHCALAEALQRAGEDVAARRVDRVVVLAADSYLDAESLAWLYGQGRLKGALGPMGTLPGEAGATVLVEAATVARARSAARGGQVLAVALSDEWETEEPPPSERVGRALAEVVRRVLPERRPFVGDVLLDLNGEAWRAQAWGHAQMYLTREHLDFERCRLTVPAECLGETGAASGPLAVGVAVGAFVWGHNPEGQALVLSLSESGRVAAIRLGSIG